MDRPVLNFNPIVIHPEEEPNTQDLNLSLELIDKDLHYIDHQIIEAANNYKGLMEKAKTKLNNIKELLNIEKERQQDINILCNKYSDFSSIINITKENVSGDLNFDNHILSAPIVTTSTVKYKVEAVDGNGYEGNKYVYANENFIENTIDTSNRNNISDGNLTTMYEYSRITVNNNVNDVPMMFNKDSIEAECSITIAADETFNKINITTDRNDLILRKVFTSNDGLMFKLDKEYNIAINERQERYNEPGYIYGSGIIAVEPTKHLKLSFKSNGYTNETIAHVKTFYNDTNSNEIIKKIEKVDLAKRHIISIGDISLNKNVYSKGSIISNELITDPVTCIGLYCNEYINKDYTIENNVSYFLIINGNEYSIDPINCHRNGKKIIRTSSQIYQSEHVIYVNEKIKSAKLKIVINTANSDITPYLSDIKILIGGE